MAVVHRATLTPGKLELLGPWLEKQPWAGGFGELDQLGSYRFDDPEGEVGIEALLVAAGAKMLHLPLTYRGAPLAGAEDFLIGTMEHSVLGPRWCYDGCADPAAARAFLHAILTGGHEAELLVEESGEIVDRRDPTVRVRGTGSLRADDVPHVGSLTIDDLGAQAVVSLADFDLTIARIVPAELAGDETLSAVWHGGESVVAAVRALD
ncbi:CG0192-related protein [Nocardioides sp.]|uniref:CG0192-related protein n=1 Tax=Nocardioides sp. TaxID=35761 RepID=UPI0039E605DE